MYALFTYMILISGAVSVSAPEYFSEGLSSGHLNSVNCSGTETQILECYHLSSDHGFSCDSAGVVCQGNMPLSL